MGGLSRKPMGIILVVLALIAGAWMLFGGGGRSASIPQTGGSGSVGGDLGRVFVASEVDRTGCPLQTETSFGAGDTVYAGLTESVIPAGTEIFARLSYEGDPVEDTDAIVADRDLQSCAWFEFSPNGGFDPGRYQVDVYVNGNRYDGQSFNVGQGGGLLGSGGNSAGSAQLGDLYTTTEVDRNGCPTDDAAEFYSDEAVYLSLTESYVPAGTEMYARLSYEGQAVEDTDPIVADRDLQSCVWFVFEPTGRGFDPGRYEAELIVNGRSVDSISFDVR